MHIIILLAICFFVFSSQLKIKITEKGIHVSLPPFKRKETFISVSEITAIQLISYSPIKEYGGWGIRRNLKGVQAYTISGTKGLLIELVNKKKYLIGTTNTKEMDEFLTTHKQYTDSYKKTSEKHGC